MPENKFAQTKDDEKKKIGKSEEKFPNSNIETVKITFRQNRKFHLHLGRYVFTFNGRESKEIPKNLIEHKDFTENIKQYFVIN